MEWRQDIIFSFLPSPVPTVLSRSYHSQVDIYSAELSIIFEKILHGLIDFNLELLAPAMPEVHTPEFLGYISQ